MELYQGEKILPIPGFEDKYQVTSTGRVWSNVSNRWLKPTINKRGNYCRAYVSLGRGNKFYVHQLVAKAFIPNPNNYTEIDHIDTNPLNNNVENLRWVNRQQNMDNEKTKERTRRNTGYYLEIENLETKECYWGNVEASEKTGLSKATIQNHVLNKVKTPRFKYTGRKMNPTTKEILEK